MSYVEIDYTDLIPVADGFKVLKDCTAREVFAHADQLRSDGNYWRKVAFELLNESKRRAAETVKSRETRLRRSAERQGLMLVKSRRRDPHASDFGLYVLVDDSKGNRVGRYGGQAAVSAFARGEGVTLDDVETMLG